MLVSQRFFKTAILSELPKSFNLIFVQVLDETKDSVLDINRCYTILGETIDARYQEKWWNKNSATAYA